MEFIDKTMVFKKGLLEEESVSDILLSVYDSLAEKGYNPVNQIVGYLMSGDPAYIPRHNDARNAIRHYERDEILEELLQSYLKANGRG